MVALMEENMLTIVKKLPWPGAPQEKTALIEEHP